MRRAYSVFDVKEVKGEPGRRNFEAVATTPTPDRSGDVVEPKGAQFKLPMPFLYQHDSRRPIGQITEAKVTGNGIKVKGYVETLDGPPTLKERLDVAWAEMVSGLVRGVSIGFIDKVSEVILDADGYFMGFLFKEWEWLELSAVTIPANSEASITSIKSIDERMRTASGHSTQPKSKDATTTTPGVTGTSTKKGAVFSVTNQGVKVKTIAEQIAGFEATRAAKAAEMEKLMNLSGEEGRTLTKEEQEEYDGIEKDVDEIDNHLKRLRAHQKRIAEKPAAEEVTGATGPGAAGTGSVAGVTNQYVGMKGNSNLPAGIQMARYVKALAFAKGNYQQATEYAKQWDSSSPEVGLALKAAVGAGTTSDSVWAGPLVYNQDFPAAFLDFLRPQTIIGKLTGISRVPFNIRYGIQDGGSTVSWVGQGLPKPVTKLHFTSGSLGFAKAAGIVVITQELARFSSPSAELKVRDDLTAQMVQFLDQQFIDPGVAAVANVSPASVLNGATNVRQAAAAWTTMAAVITDVKVLLSTFAANEISLQGAYWVMTPDTALSLGLLLNTGGTAFAFPEIDVNGGTFLGIPVIVSNSVPHSVSAGAVVALVVPKHLYLADDGAIAIDASTEASLQMDSAPGTQDATSGTGTSLVSMFQTNSIAVRVERIINWSRARTYAVGYIDNMHTS